MDILEKLLFDLGSFVESLSIDSNGSDGNTDPNAIILNIELCIKAFDLAEVDTAIFLLLRSQVPANIFRYMDGTMRSKDRLIIKSKVAAFKLISYLVKQGIGIESHVSYVLENCMDIFRREDSNEVKVQCLGPVKNLMRDVESFKDIFSDSNISSDDYFKIFTEEFYANKLAKGLRGELLSTFGILIQRSSQEEGKDIGSWVLTTSELAWNLLRTNVLESIEPDFQVLSGALSALDRCLVHRVAGCVKLSELWKIILRIVSSVSNPSVARYAHIRKALRLVSHHGELFNELIGLNAQQSYNVFLSCFNAEKEALKKYVESALLIILEQMASYAHKRNGQQDCSEFCLKTISLLIDQFMRGLNSTSAGEVTLAVKGLAALAPAYSIIVINNDSGDGGGVDKIVSRMIRSAEQFVRSTWTNDAGLKDNFGESNATDSNASVAKKGVLYYSTKTLERKADFLLAISSVFLSSDASMSSDWIEFMLNYAIDLVVGYSRLWLRTRKVVHKSISSFIRAMYTRVVSLDDDKKNTIPYHAFCKMLDALIGCLVARSISRLVDGEVPEVTPFDPTTGELDDHLYSVFMPLWDALFSDLDKLNCLALSPSKSKLLLSPNVPSANTELYDAVMRCICHYFDHIDISYSHIAVEMPETLDGLETSVPSSDGGHGDIIPNNPADQEILLNLMSFLELFLSCGHQKDRLIQHWFSTLINIFIPMSMTFKLVSGLYKGIEILLTSVFSEEQENKSACINVIVHVDLITLRRYLDSVVTEAQSFQQELQSTTLSLLLSLPALSICGFKKLIPVLLTSLEAGLHVVACIRLMEACLGTADLVEGLPDILPLLDKYLIGPSTRTKEGTMDRGTDESDIQRCVLRFMGSLGGYNKLILNDATSSMVDTIGWSSEGHQCVPYRLPTSNEDGVDFVLCIDKLIPRITELTMQVSDRATRTAAAELLHSVIVMMIGNKSIDPGYLLRYNLKDTTDVSGLYRKIFPVALQLAVSDELVIRDLFEKLMGQVTHWFSGTGQVPFADSSALMDALLTNVTNSRQGELRELCSKLLTEFFSWSIRQSTSAELKSANANKSVNSCDGFLEKILNLVTHPMKAHRIGGVAVFNKIYVYFREERGLVNRYLLRIVYSLLMAIRLECDEKEVDVALRRYVKILVKSVKKDGEACLLLREDEASDEANKGFPSSLHELLRYCYGNLVHEHTLFRRSCMYAMAILAPLQSFVLSHRERYFTLEGGKKGKAQAISDTKFTSFYLSTVLPEEICKERHIYVPDNTNILDDNTYLNRLSASADYYNWLISLNFLSLESLFDSKLEQLFNTSNVWSQWTEFVSVCALHIRGSLEQRDLRFCNSSKLSELRSEVLRRGLFLMVNVLEKSLLFHKFDEVIVKMSAHNVISCELFELTFGVLFAICCEDDALFPGTSSNVTIGEYIPSLCERLFRIAGDGSSLLLMHSSLDVVIRHCLSYEHIQRCDSNSLSAIVSAVRLLERYEKYSNIVDQHRTAFKSMCHRSISQLIESASNLSSIESKKGALVLELVLGLRCVELVGRNDYLAIESTMGNTTAVCEASILIYVFNSTIICGAQNMFFQNYNTVLAKAYSTERNLRAHLRDLLPGFRVICSQGQNMKPETLSIFSSLLESIFINVSVDVEKISRDVLIMLMTEIVSNLDWLYLYVSILEIICQLDVCIRSTLTRDNQYDLVSELLRNKLINLLSPILRDSSISRDTILKFFPFLKYLLPGVCVNSLHSCASLGGMDDPLNDRHIKELIESIEELVANTFPMNTAALDTTSEAGISYAAIFSSYLSTLAASGSICLFGPLLPTLRAGKKHLYYNWIKNTFNEFVNSIDMRLEYGSTDGALIRDCSGVSCILAMFNFCYGLICDKEESVHIKRTIATHLWIPLLRIMPVEILSVITTLIVSSDGRLTRTTGVVTDITKTAIYSFISIIQKPITPFTSSTSTIGNVSHLESVAESVHVTMEMAFTFIETVYSRCALSDIKGFITQAYAGPSASGKELTQAICRAAHKQVRDVIGTGGSSILTKARSVVCQVAYSCLLCVVAKTQSEEAIYENFLFKEKPGESFWINVIDCDVEYVFEAECPMFASVTVGSTVKDLNDFNQGKSYHESQKKNLNSLRKFGLSGLGSMSQEYFSVSLQSLSGVMDTSVMMPSRKLGDAKQPMTMTSASLLDDSFEYTVEDNISSAMEISSNQYKQTQKLYGIVSSINSSMVAGFDDYNITFELNHVNLQSCVGSFLRVILRMAVLFNDKWISDVHQFPKWLKELIDRLRNNSVHRNVRLFILRMLLNQPVTSIVRPWASSLIPIILEACFELLLSDSISGNEKLAYSYFLRDLVFVLVDTWSEGTCGPEATGICSKFVGYLISAVYHSKSSLLTENSRGTIALITLWISKGQITMSSLNTYFESSIRYLFSGAAQPTGGALGSTSSRGTEVVKMRMTGLRIVQAMIDSGLDVLRRDFDNQAGACIIQYVTEGVKYPRKEVMQISATIAGKLLETMSKVHYDTILECLSLEESIERICSLKLNVKGGLEDVATILHGVSRHCSSFLSRELLLRLLSVFTRFSSRSKAYFLEYLVRNDKSYDPKIDFLEYLQPHLQSLMTDLYSVADGRGARMRHYKAIRLYTIRLLYKKINDLPTSVYPTILGNSPVEGLGLITTVLDSDGNDDGAVLIRKEGYILLMTLFNNLNTILLRSAGDGVLSSKNEPIHILIRRILVMILKGLVDPDDAGMTRSNNDDSNEKRNVNPSRYWESVIQTSPDIGIRKLVYDFFTEKILSHSTAEGRKKGSMSISNGSMLEHRLEALMTRFYDPKCAAQWLNYSCYILFELCIGEGNLKRAEKAIFEIGLGNESNFTEYEPSRRSSTSLSHTIADPRRPMFSLERTTQRLVSQSVAMAADQSDTTSSQYLLLSQFGASASQQAASVARRSGFLRASQQFDWSQTQSASQSNVSGFEEDDGESIRSNASKGRPNGNNFAPTQMLAAGVPSFLLQSKSDTGSIVSLSQFKHQGEYSSNSVGSYDASAMPPPMGLPRELTAPKVVITQRLPHRYQGYNTSTNSNVPSDVSKAPGGELRGTAVRYYTSRLKTVQKKKQELSKQNNRVVIYRKYRVGELPDICISHVDVVAPMQALCLRDNKFAALAFEAMFQMIYGSTVVDGDRSSLNLRIALCRMLGDGERARDGISSSEDSLLPMIDRQLVSSLLSSSLFCVRQEFKAISNELFVQRQLLNSKARGGLSLDLPGSNGNKKKPSGKVSILNTNEGGGAQDGSDASSCFLLSELNSELIASIARQSMNYHSGILLLEEQLLTKELKTQLANSLDSHAAQKTNRHKSANYHDLCSVYEALGDKDALVGLYAKFSACSETKQALDAEISGNFPAAIRFYNQLIVRFKASDMVVDSDVQPSPEEVELWDERSLQCLEKLMDWSQLDEKLNDIASENVSADTLVLSHASRALHTWEKFLISHLDYPLERKKKYLSMKLNCLINNDNDEIPVQEFLGLLANAPRDTSCETLKRYVESIHPFQYSTCYAVTGDWLKVQSTISQCYDQFLTTWSALHKSAVEARTELLLQLQSIVELDDSSLFKLNRSLVKSRGGKCVSFDEKKALKCLLRKWSHSLPLISDPVGVWNEVIRIRHLLLDASGGTDAAIHLSRMHIALARAAVHQNILHVVKGQIALGGALKRAAITNADTSLNHDDSFTLEEVLAVYSYNQITINALTKDNQAARGDEPTSAVFDLNKVLAMFDKTSGLLDRKLEQLTSSVEFRGNKNLLFADKDYLKLSMMKAMWMCDRWAVMGFPKDYQPASDAFELMSYLASNVPIVKATLNDVQADLESMKRVSSAQEIRLLGSIYEQLAKHCSKLKALDMMKKPLRGPNGIVQSIGTVCIDAHLKGLQLCNAYCRDRLVATVQLIAVEFNTSDLTDTSKLPPYLIGQINATPAWLFLRHAAQLMGYLDRPEGVVAALILDRVAATYPGALYFHYKITSEGLGKKGSVLAIHMSRLLNNPSVNAFVEALDGLTHPDLRVIDALKEAITYQRTIVGKITPAMTNEALRATSGVEKINKNNDGTSRIIGNKNSYVVLCEMLAACKNRATALSWDYVNGRIGSYNRSVTKDFKKLFDSFLPAMSGSSVLFKLNDDSLLLLLNKVKEAIGKRFDSGKVALLEFSDWLAEFDFDVHKIEMPGQYFQNDVDVEPDVSSHSYIVGFDPLLLVMPSIRRPKRITVFGTSGQVKLFLVKGGEDLRNDDRIQQLFNLMNSIVASSSSVSSFDMTDDINDSDILKLLAGKASRSIRAKTFTVVPMTSKLGILEWVQNTTPLKAILSTELAKDADFVAANPKAVERVAISSSGGSRGRGASSSNNQSSLEGSTLSIQMQGMEASSMRQSWLTSQGGYEGTIKKMVNVNFRDGEKGTDASELWPRMLSYIPSDLIRRFLLRKMQSPEAFYVARNEFARSIAVSSIYGYILGIGDRHLENLLIDNHSGAVVMIDFGICFGMGTSCLPIPELIPFRMTPQISNALMPLHGIGLLRHFMIKVLTSLRSKEGVERLANDLEVYINDPLVDWLKGSGVAKDDLSELRSELTWEPRRRVEAVLRKLKGDHPMHIMLDDLVLNVSVKKHGTFAGYVNLFRIIDAGAIDRFDSLRKPEAVPGSTYRVGKKRKLADRDEKSDGRITSSSAETAQSSLQNELEQSSNPLPFSEHCDNTIAFQVDALIDLATCPEILCRQYEGLMAWM